MRRISAVLLAIGGIACLAARAAAQQKVYIAPTNETIVTNVEEPFGTRRERITYVENRSTVPIIVYSVLLTSCTNVTVHCDAPVTLKVRVPAGRRSVIMRVEPRDKAAGYTYRLGFRWRPESDPEATLSSIATGPAVDPRRDPQEAERAEAARRAAAGIVDKRLDLADINALGARIARARVEPDSVVMNLGDTLDLARVRIRMILFDSAGARLGRVNDMRWRLRPDMLTRVPPYGVLATSAGRGAIEFILPEEALPDRTLMLEPAIFTVIVRP